jgi:hypothetical protein
MAWANLVGNLADCVHQGELSFAEAKNVKAGADGADKILCGFLPEKLSKLASVECGFLVADYYGRLYAVGLDGLYVVLENWVEAGFYHLPGLAVASAF